MIYLQFIILIISLLILDAIEFTKCDIISAAKKIPKNCIDYEDQSKCINALWSNEQGQFWTSYHGYLLDVTKTCFIYSYSIKRGI